MKIKYRVTDFRVSELLECDYIREDGPFAVFRVTKRKLSTPEAAAVLAERAGVDAALVAIAGLKDRQGVTVQHMTVPGRQRVRVDERELKIEHIGFAAHELSSLDSRGNAFHVVVRSIDARELAILRRNIPTVREHGVPNYFDDQRFGNLRHDQGWIARDLMQGQAERALHSLLAAPSPFDHERLRAFKSGLRKAWGDWRTCRDVAGRFGSHHSVFEYLTAHEGDFSGSFYHVASRLRLIHLFAYQSHVWNRAVAELVRRHVPTQARVIVDSAEGGLVCFEGEAPATLAGRSFRLPGPGLEDVSSAEDRAILTEVLAGEEIVPEGFRIDGVPGFQLKGEDRELVVHPRHLRVRPATDDPDHPGTSVVLLRFELPRGAYATLVVRRLFARSQEKRSEYREERSRSFSKGEWIGHADNRAGREDDAPRASERNGPGHAGERRSVPRRGDGEGSGKPWRGRRALSARREGRTGGGSREGERDRSGDWSSSPPRAARGVSDDARTGDRRGRSEGRGTAWRGGERGGTAWRGGERGGSVDRRGANVDRTHSGGRPGSRSGDQRGRTNHDTPWRGSSGRGPGAGRGDMDRRGGWRDGDRDRSHDARGGQGRGDRRAWVEGGGARERGNEGRGAVGRGGSSRGTEWRGGSQRRGDGYQRGSGRRDDSWHGRDRPGGSGSARPGEQRGGERRGNPGRRDWKKGTRGSSQRAGGHHGGERRGESTIQPAEERE